MSKRRSKKTIDSRYLFLPIVALSVLLWSRHITADAFTSERSAREALNGVFVCDFVNASDESMGQWTDLYRAKFGAVGLLRGDPPLLAAVQALTFMGTGVDVVISRAIVIAFGVIAMLALYWVVAQIFDSQSGVFAAAVWATLPGTVLWARCVDPIIPAVAMTLLACGVYLKFRQTRNNAYLIVAAVLLVLAVFACYASVFAAAVLGIDALMNRPRRNGKKKRFGLVVSGIVAGLICGYLLFVWRRFDVGCSWRQVLSFGRWWFCVESLPMILGWSGLAFAGIGLLLLAVTGNSSKLRLAMLWAVGVYVLTIAAPNVTVRHVCFLAPLAAMTIGAGLSDAMNATNLKGAAELLLVVFVVWQFVLGMRAATDRAGNYTDVARYVTRENRFQTVLFAGRRSNQFAYDLRNVQGVDGRTYTVWVGSTGRNLARLADRYAVRYIVVEPPFTSSVPAGFVHETSFKIGNGRTVDIYANTHAVDTRQLLIPLPNSNRELQLQLQSR